MADQTLVLTGYRELLRSLASADKRTRREVRTTLRLVGESVRADAQRDFSSYGTRSASGGTFGGSRASHAESAARYRVIVRQRGVSVEQTLRRTTGAHPEYAKAQMRHGFLPALDANEGRIVADMELALDRVAEAFNRGA